MLEYDARQRKEIVLLCIKGLLAHREGILFTAPSRGLILTAYRTRRSMTQMSSHLNDLEAKIKQN
jgi:hypothetical protein